MFLILIYLFLLFIVLIISLDIKCPVPTQRSRNFSTASMNYLIFRVQFANNYNQIINTDSQVYTDFSLGLNMHPCNTGHSLL